MALCEPTHNGRDVAVRCSRDGRGITGGYGDHSFTSGLHDNNDYARARSGELKGMQPPQ